MGNDEDDSRDGLQDMKMQGCIDKFWGRYTRNLHVIQDVDGPQELYVLGKVEKASGDSIYEVSIIIYDKKRLKTVY